jgi:hypothetical protein
MLVHLADAKDIAAIRRSGIRTDKYADGVFAMPVLPNFVVSHQWLRELKRGGARTLSAVHFRIPDDEIVMFGHYVGEPVAASAAEAAGAIMRAEEPLGMQILVQRAIAAKEIHAFRAVPQTVGWRYFPSAHDVKPCGCPACVRRGAIKSRKLRDAYEADFRSDMNAFVATLSAE